MIKIIREWLREVFDLLTRILLVLVFLWIGLFSFLDAAGPELPCSYYRAGADEMTPTLKFIENSIRHSGDTLYIDGYRGGRWWYGAAKRLHLVPVYRTATEVLTSQRCGQ